MLKLRTKVAGYYLTRLIGTGKTGQVYLGINPASRSKRALKIIPKGGSQPFQTGLLGREIESLQDLHHLNIMRPLEWGEMDGAFYFVTEYAPGGNLAEKLKHGPISDSEALRIFAFLCDGLEYAHSRGVVHGNIRPSNVLFSADRIPALSDFRIAGLNGDPRLPLGETVEYLKERAYVAPEQESSCGMLDRRGDVYALGAILYDMLTGAPPLRPVSAAHWAHVTLPYWALPILEKCLAASPERRYEHGRALRQHLTELQNSGPGNGCRSVAVRVQLPASEEATDLSADRIERWFRRLRTGSTKERLATIREMIDRMEPHEARAAIKLYSEEHGPVRWGLIKVLGELRTNSAVPMIIRELNNPYHAQGAIEALGKIGSQEAFHPLAQFLSDNPGLAGIALLPLAQTGKKKALGRLSGYLKDHSPELRCAAAVAIGSVQTPESLYFLKTQLYMEEHMDVRAALVESIHSLEAVLIAGIGENATQSALPEIAGHNVRDSMSD